MTMISPTYDLRDSNYSSRDFYLRLEALTNQVLDQGQRRLGLELHSFQEWARENGIEAFSQPECLLELLSLGLAWERYLGASQGTKLWIIAVLKGLLGMRKWSEGWKKMVDPWRGRIAGRFVIPQIGHAPKDLRPSLKNARRLLRWLSATGEYDQEVKRLSYWLQFFAKSKLDFSHSLLRILETYHWFKTRAQAVLGTFTSGVKAYKQQHQKEYQGREDEFFCQKPEAEYHLNMFAASVMNRALRPGFEQTQRRVVLLPGCMRRDEYRCQMEEANGGLFCAGCRPDCAVNQIRKEGLSEGFETRIILHSTKFSQSLAQWRGQTEVGVVASGCVLNLISGGYQFRRGKIPSQCLPLDYCGCRKHWDKVGKPTDLSLDRLRAIVQK
jgi:hypothetical protein